MITDNFTSFPFQVHYLGRCEYLCILEAMQAFTKNREVQTKDQIWIAEHYPVYTLGQNANIQDIVRSTSIPIVQSDRGGKITYHGLGQLVIYTLLDLKRLHYHLREVVTQLEKTIIKVLLHYGIQAYAKKTAPGVYIQGQKIAFLGLRIKKHCSYHGIALNVDMDLSPFRAIHPCGDQTLKITQLRAWTTLPTLSLNVISQKFLQYWSEQSPYL